MTEPVPTVATAAAQHADHQRAAARGPLPFVLVTLLTAAALRTVSLTLHYLGPSPWGGPLVLSPDRFLPDALFIEWGLLLTAALPMALVDARLAGTPRTAVRVIWSLGLTLHLAFSQFDQEIVRWLSQHVSASYLRNFFGVNDPLLLQRILSGDQIPTALAVLQVFVACVCCGWWLRRQGQRGSHVSRRTLLWMLAGAVLFTSAHQWFRPSEKRWRRVQPAVLGLAADVWRAASGAETPTVPARAEQDLVDVVWTGRLDAQLQPPAPFYPLWRQDNVGTRSAAAFQTAPLAERPNVVVIVFETMRAWNTGLHPDTTLASGTPQLDAFAREHARVFPFLHSNGFPSVEGSMAMHLGIWPHFRRIVFSDYGHIRSQAMPEALRAVGYDTFVLLGADPSFSNFTPWITRWYNRWEYRPENHHDGPLVDRFTSLWDEATATGERPVFGMLWTATTHPPYDLPASEGIAPGADDEARFLQAVAYADRHVTRLLEHLRARPDWDRTVVLVLGDHAQPTPWQWQNSDRIGALTPGHTWTQLVVTGGWPGLPARGRDDRTLSHVDIPPSVLGLLDLQLPNHFMGRNVLGGEQPVPVAWDAPITSNDDAPLIPTFRMGDVVLLTPDGRAGFRIHGADRWHVAIDRTREVEYGLLEGSTARIQPGLPDAIDPVRWRDLVLAWGRLLDDNRLMPPPEQAASPTP